VVGGLQVRTAGSVGEGKGEKPEKRSGEEIRLVHQTAERPLSILSIGRVPEGRTVAALLSLHLFLFFPFLPRIHDDAYLGLNRLQCLVRSPSHPSQYVLKTSLDERGSESRRAKTTRSWREVTEIYYVQLVSCDRNSVRRRETPKYTFFGKFHLAPNFKLKCALPTNERTDEA